MSSSLDWLPDFCLFCDRQTSGGAPYCSDACRVGDVMGLLPADTERTSGDRTLTQRVPAENIPAELASTHRSSTDRIVTQHVPIRRTPASFRNRAYSPSISCLPSSSSSLIFSALSPSPSPLLWSPSHPPLSTTPSQSPLSISSSTPYSCGTLTPQSASTSAYVNKTLANPPVQAQSLRFPPSPPTSPNSIFQETLNLKVLSLDHDLVMDDDQSGYDLMSGWSPLVPEDSPNQAISSPPARTRPRAHTQRNTPYPSAWTETATYSRPLSLARAVVTPPSSNLQSPAATAKPCAYPRFSEQTVRQLQEFSDSFTRTRTRARARTVGASIAIRVSRELLAPTTAVVPNAVESEGWDSD